MTTEDCTLRIKKTFQNYKFVERCLARVKKNETVIYFVEYGVLNEQPILLLFYFRCFQLEFHQNTRGIATY